VAENLAGNVVLVEKVKSTLNQKYYDFKNQKENLKIDETDNVADGMFRCFRNKTLADAEKEEDNQNRSPDTRANVGSPRFFRLVLNKAGIGAALTTETNQPFTYSTRANPEIEMSEQDGKFFAAVMNALTRYSIEKCKWTKRAYDFWTQIFKGGNLAVAMNWKKDTRRVAVKNKKDRIEFREMCIDQYPDFTIIPVKDIFASITGGDLSEQQIVITQRLVSWMDIEAEARSEVFDKTIISEMRAKRDQWSWNQSEGHEELDDKVTNEGAGGSLDTSHDSFMRFDMYAWLPIQNKKWDDSNALTLWWATFIGNCPSEAKCVRLETDFSPTGKIPMTMIHCLPDDSDLLFHTTYAQAVRSRYSVECTIMNQILDAQSKMVNKPHIYNSELLKRPPSSEALFSFNGGEAYDVDNVDGFYRDLQYSADIQGMHANLRAVMDDEDLGMGASRNQAGQSFGARTTGIEVMTINKFSEQPANSEYGYIATQFFGFLAENYLAYWQAYGDPIQIKAIADDVLDPMIYGKDRDGVTVPYGMFNIKLDVIESGIADFMKAQQELQLWMTTANAQGVFANSNFRFDPAAWLADILRRLGVKNISKFVSPRKDRDATMRQRQEIDEMRRGVLVEVNPDDNHAVHIDVINATLAQIEPMIATARGLGREIENTEWVEPLKAHKAVHEQMLAQERAQQAQAAQQNQPTVEGGTPAQQAMTGPQQQLGGLLGG